MFYASPATARPGELVNICYGTDNATGVSIAPAIEELKPSLSRCVQLKATKTQTFELTALQGDRKTTKTLELTVAGAPISATQNESAGTGLIQTFASTTPRIKPGAMATLCLVLAPGVTATITPEVGRVQSLKGCMTVQPKQTTNYTLTAKSGETTEKKSIEVVVAN